MFQPHVSIIDGRETAAIDKSFLKLHTKKDET